MNQNEWGGARQTHNVFHVELGSPQKTRTYNLTTSIIDRLDNLALQLSVGQSDLARFLLNYALDQVESGALEIPTVTRPGRIIDASY